MKKIFTLLVSICIYTNVWAQGYIDFATNTWTPSGSVSQTFNTVGTPAINVTAAVTGFTNRFINNTPRPDARGLWLSVDLASRVELVTLTFTFSEPVTNLSFGIKGIDRDLSFSNYQDKVAVDGFDDNGVVIAPSVSYNSRYAFVSNVSGTNTKLISGLNPDAYDSSSVVVTFPSAGIKRLVLTYGTGSDIRPGNITAQNIFLTYLAWSSIVPVQLMYFRGKSDNNRSRLSWATATEINSDYFDVERSVDLKQFTSLGRVTAAGESRQQKEYSFLDEAPLPGVNYYRLKQVDKDGSFEYSKIIALNPQSGIPQLAVYPNPSDGNNIKLLFDNVELDKIKLVDILGVEIPFKIESGSNNSLEIKPVRPLQSGTYWITHAAAGQARLVQKLVIIK